MKFKAEVQVVIRDKNGKVVKRYPKKLCKSYVRQMIDLLRVGMSQSVGSIKRTNETISGIYPNLLNFKVDAGAGVSTYGIQVGTGNNAVTINDFKLSAQVQHADTPPIFLYGSVSVGVVTVVGSTASFVIARTFTNQTGADIDFKEVGLVCIAESTAIFILLERSLLEFTIADTESGTVTYTISVTV